MMEQHPEDMMHGGSGIGGWRRRRNLIIGGVTTVVLIIIISVSVSVSKKKSSSRSVDLSQLAQLRGMIDSALKNQGIPTTEFDAEGSYQNKAITWLAKNEELETFDRSQILQRFALACFYYSTHQIETLYTPSPRPWKSATHWLTDQHECQWLGVDCNAHLKVNGINLEQNDLTGAPPVELALLRDHLDTIDFTTNQLHIEGSQWEFLRRLDKLERILMDDNFLLSSDGLPNPFGDLSNLRKVRLSYNLIGGSLNGQVLEGLSQLTHLEIESNFLTGQMPEQIGKMENLVYLYLRRNEMDFNLNFLKAGQMSNLFAMWLDNNQIVGTIPTEIGLLSELASISMTNCTLSGPIPSELGQLSGLRRIWLYQNRLTGTIPTELANLDKLEVFEVHNNNLAGEVPQGVCDAVDGSTYIHKSLTADCQALSCKNCCTNCN